MTAAVVDRPLDLAGGDGGTPARRAMGRWAWRLFRREWRQQALVLALLIVAVAGTVVGLGVASNADQLKHNPLFGTANTIIGLSGSDPHVSADIAAIQNRFGAVDVVAHQNLPIPGSVSNIDLRAEDPHAQFGNVTLRLDSGRYPTGTSDVAVTKDVASLLGIRIGSQWSAGGRTRQVVGIVENPLDLLDQFALVPPGQIDTPDRISVLLNTTQSSLQSFRPPNGGPLNILARGGSSTTMAEVIVLVLETLGLLFVGLMAVAGFTVMAHRRLRSLGMLGALGATDRHVRTVMVANGAAVGAVSAVVGTVVGLVAWMAFLPTLQSIAGHRIERFSLPWWAIAAAMVLTFFTAVLAAWWPARTITRISVVAALSGRPPKPQPAHRFAALGGGLVCGGIVLLAFADQRRVGFIIGGTVATSVGLLFLAPLAIRVLASTATHTTVSVRLALRDLSRYQARSGAALGAVTLAVGIASTIAISASGAQSDSGPGNLPSNQMILYVGGNGSGGQVPPLTASEQQTLATAVGQVGASIHARQTVPLVEAYDPQGDAVPSPGGGQIKCPVNSCAGAGQSDGYPTAGLAQVTITAHGEDVSGGSTLYVATPEVLALYGIQQRQINPNADILSFQRSLGTLQIFSPNFSRTNGPGPRNDMVGTAHPVLETFAGLPQYGSDPGTLITPKAMQSIGLQPIPAGWLLETDRPLTASQIGTARQEAATVGLFMETRQAQKSLAPLRNWSTTAGILLALGVLAMTVGLIRSETANDLRTLAATGASSNTRRNLTAATAGALALLGGLLGTAGAYAALLAWHRSHLTPLGHVPIANLVVVLVGLPAIATVGGWLLAGHEPAVVSRTPLE